MSKFTRPKLPIARWLWSKCFEDENTPRPWLRRLDSIFSKHEKVKLDAELEAEMARHYESKQLLPVWLSCLCHQEWLVAYHAEQFMNIKDEQMLLGRPMTAYDNTTCPTCLAIIHIDDQLNVTIERGLLHLEDYEQPADIPLLWSEEAGAWIEPMWSDPALFDVKAIKNQQSIPGSYAPSGGGTGWLAT